MYKRLPKVGFHNPGAREMQAVNLDKVQEYINMGRLVPKEGQFTTMRDLYNVGLVSKVKDGIKLLARVSIQVTTKY